MATARGEQDSFHRPCLQKQSQKRTHRQAQLRTHRQRHQSPYSCCSRCSRSSCSRTVIESNPARAGADRELSCGAGELPESETRLRHLSHFQDSVRSRRRIRDPGPDGKRRPGRKRREHSRHLTRAPPRAPYSRRWDRTHTSPPPPRPPAALEEAAPRRGRPSSRLHDVYDEES